MLRAVLLACGLVAALPLQAAEDEAALAAVKDLGRLNGQALACAYPDTASWTRVLMLNHAPKTRVYGEAFETGTQEAFAAHSRGEACPDGSALVGRLEQVTERLRAALPAKPAAE